MIRIVSIDIVSLTIPLQASPGLGAGADGKFLLIRLKDQTGCHGVGEHALGTGHSERDLDQLRENLRRIVLPLFTDRRYTDLTTVCEAARLAVDTIPSELYGACCAVESALLDLVGRRRFCSAGDILGPVRRPAFRYSGRIAGDAVGSVKDQALDLRRAGVREVTLAVGPDPDVICRSLDLASQILGDRVRLRVAAGGAWTASRAIDALNAMASWRLSGIEQPVAPGDLEGMAVVTAAGLVPVIAYGTVATRDDAQRLASARACDVIGVRISRCGGLTNAAAIHRIAREAGMGCELEAEASEAGWLAAAGLQFACRAEGVRYAEFATILASLPPVVTEPCMDGDISLPVNCPSAPGLGIRAREDDIAEFVTHRISFS